MTCACGYGLNHVGPCARVAELWAYCPHCETLFTGVTGKSVAHECVHAYDAPGCGPFVEAAHNKLTLRVHVARKVVGAAIG